MALDELTKPENTERISAEKEEFKQIYGRFVSRKGGDRLLLWLETQSDFFESPASSRFHGAEKGGLLHHSLNVYHALRDHYFEEGDSEESFAICGLLHDVCKANFYAIELRNRKNEATGQWEKVPSYKVEDSFPYGHGEKSVFMIERFMRLTLEEAIAIRWHMGGFDEAVMGGSRAMNAAYEQYPLAVKLHLADQTATHLWERDPEKHKVRCVIPDLPKNR